MEDITKQCDQELSLLLFNTEFHYNALCRIARSAISESDMIECSRDYYIDFYHCTEDQEEEVEEVIPVPPKMTVEPITDNGTITIRFD